MELRIYCICGQKMKVSDNMFGRPGKCVACRQKIRIPMPDELPPGETEVHLKKHPEFLRKPSGRSNIPQVTTEPSSGADEVSLEGIMEKVLPVDTCEPLRILLSFERKIQRQQAALGNSDGGGAATILKDYQDRVASLKAAVRDQCQQKLIEFAADLGDVQEQIEKTEVLMRAGQGEFKEQVAFMDRLRLHRDYLERWLQNVRGWLVLTDPHEAGGYINLPFDQIPQTPPPLNLVSEPDDIRNLLNPHMEMLRAALSQRDDALQKIAGVNYISPSADLSTMAITDMRADIEAAKLRAEAVIAFCRARLDQLGNDVAQDILCYQNEIERNRRRFYNREIDESLYQLTERELIRSRDDVRNTGMLVTRALIAGGAQDIPHPRRTFLERIARPVTKQSSDTTLDALLSYVVAVLMGLGVFAPIIEGQSALQAYQNIQFQHEHGLWIFLMPIVAAMFVTLATVISRPHLRGLTMTAAWCGLTILGLSILYASQYSSNPIALSFWRDPTYWLFRPGILLFVLADFVMLASAIVALYPFKKWRLVPFIAIILVVFLLSGLFILSMVFKPQPKQQPKPKQTSGFQQLSSVQNAASPGIPDQFPAAEKVEPSPVLHKETTKPATSDSAFLKKTDTVFPKTSEKNSTAEAATDQKEDEPTPPGAQLELRGSMLANGKNPKFSILLHLPNSTPQPLELTIDKKVIGSWKIREFNRETKTVTIDNGEKLIILRPGVPTAVE